MNAKPRRNGPEPRQGPVATSEASAARITRSLLAHVNAIAESCGAAAVFVYADALEGRALPLDEEIRPRAYYLTRTPAEEKGHQAHRGNSIRVPDVSLTRMAQSKVALFLALSRGIVTHGDVIVCLSGAPASGTLDTILVTEVGRQFAMFSVDEHSERVPAEIRPEIVERIVNIAFELGSEGREGKPVGATFVVGDSARVISLSRQLIINPFRGYQEQERHVLDPALEETFKELSTLDGAFIVRGDGVIETCGTFLKDTSQGEYELPRGLGARHHSAAAITAMTNSLAVTVSESTGSVSIFRNGTIVTEFENLRSPTHPQTPYSLPG